VSHAETKAENYEDLAEKAYVDPAIKSITFENLRKKNHHIRFTLSTIASNSADIINFHNNYSNLIHLEEESTEIPALVIQSHPTSSQIKPIYCRGTGYYEKIKAELPIKNEVIYFVKRKQKKNLCNLYCRVYV
jgi:hypothetical protein